MDSFDWETVLGGTALVVLTAIYVLPTWLACKWHHPHPVLLGLLNITLGWTLVAWIIALVSVFKHSRHAHYLQAGDDSDPDAHRAFPYDVDDALNDSRDD